MLQKANFDSALHMKISIFSPRVKEKYAHDMMAMMEINIRTQLSHTAYKLSIQQNMPEVGYPKVPCPKIAQVYYAAWECIRPGWHMSE